MGAVCFSCSQRNPGPQQSWTGSNTPSSCRNGKRHGFSCCAVFVLFLFLFCYLRDPWKQAGPGAGAAGCALCRPPALRAAPSPHRPHSRPHSRRMPATSHSSTEGSAARRDSEIQLSGSSPKDSFVFHFMSLPEFSFRLTTARADTAAPRSLGLNPQRINFKLLP